MNAVYTLRRKGQDSVTSMTFLFSDRCLLAGHESGILVLWSMGTRRPLISWEAHGASVLHALSIDLPGSHGALLLSHGRDDMIHLWDLPLGVIDTQDSTMGPKPMSFNPIWSLEVNSLNYCGLSWESIRQLIAFPSLTDSNLIDIYNYDQKAFSYRSLGVPNASKETGIVMCLEFSTFQSVPSLVAGYEDGTLIVWLIDDVTRLDTGVPIMHRIKFFTEPVLCVSIDDDTIYSGSADGSIKSLNTATGDTQLVWTHPEGKGISTLSINSSRKVMASGSWDGTTFLHSTSDHALVGQLDLHRSRVNVALFAVVNPTSVENSRDDLDEDDYAPPGTLGIGSADGRISLVFPS